MLSGRAPGCWAAPGVAVFAPPAAVDGCAAGAAGVGTAVSVVPVLGWALGCEPCWLCCPCWAVAAGPRFRILAMSCWLNSAIFLCASICAGDPRGLFWTVCQSPRNPCSYLAFSESLKPAMLRICSGRNIALLAGFACGPPGRGTLAWPGAIWPGCPAGFMFAARRLVRRGGRFRGRGTIRRIWLRGYRVREVFDLLGGLSFRSLREAPFSDDEQEQGTRRLEARSPVLKCALKRKDVDGEWYN